MKSTSLSLDKQSLAWIVPCVLLLIIAILAYFSFFTTPPEVVPVSNVAPKKPDIVDIAEESEPEYPIPVLEPEAPAVQLPDLDESDDTIRSALSRIFAKKTLNTYLVDEDVIRKLVVSIDNLNRDSIAIEKRAVKPIRGRLFVTEASGKPVLSTDNFLRYTNLVRGLKSADLDALTDIYFSHYSLFQQAYEELGYPNDYFNDRLIEILDHLIEPTQVPENIVLTRPKSLYQFNDDDLESLSAGQKILIRIGPENAVVIRLKLQALRQRIAATEISPLNNQQQTPENQDNT